MKLQPQIAGVDGGKLLNQRLGASNLERNLQKAAVKFIEPNAVLTNPNRRGSHNVKLMQNYLNENFDVKPKHSSEEVLQKWRNLGGVVKNPRRRFRFTANLSKRYEAAAMRRTNQIANPPTTNFKKEFQPQILKTQLYTFPTPNHKSQNPDGFDPFDPATATIRWVLMRLGSVICGVLMRPVGV
uniref:Calcium-transporting P-type ATPase N-terminal autoinhibitory domain-containing protein n=1 Tax=Fagus sylvatica TaxID=28930 RepID=A0A2N9F8H8_FAGSY